MLQLDRLSKQFENFRMQDLSLKVPQGNYFVLLGPSGVGKTVLLEMIAGVLPPESGRICWERRDITALPAQRRGFAMVYQDYALFPHLTVFQNIVYGLRNRRPTSRVREKVARLSDLLDIDALLPRRPGDLSGGEKQRVALARALAVEPRLLLLDEPFNALAHQTRLDLRRAVKRICRDINVTVLQVTHDPEEAMVLADTIGVMLDQQIRQVAPPEDLFRRPSDAVVADFLGMVNVLPIERIEGEICRVGSLTVHVSGVDSECRYLWIRPEEILLSTEPFQSSARNQFPATVVEWAQGPHHVSVELSVGGLILTAIVTPTSFAFLAPTCGSVLYTTCKSSAIHCF